MKHRDKNYNELKKRVALTGIDGQWVERGNHKQFYSETGAILNFWKSTGTMHFQGDQGAAAQLQTALRNMDAARAKTHTQASGKVDDQVLAALTQIVIANRLDLGQDKEAKRISEIATDCMLELCNVLGLAKRDLTAGNARWRATPILHRLAPHLHARALEDQIGARRSRSGTLTLRMLICLFDSHNAPERHGGRLCGGQHGLLRLQVWTKESAGTFRRAFVRLIASAHIAHIARAAGVPLKAASARSPCAGKGAVRAAESRARTPEGV